MMYMQPIHIVLPNYTPEQALRMHMDETFQMGAAQYCSATRSLESPCQMYTDGKLHRTSIFGAQGRAEGVFQRLLQSATPNLSYREHSVYTQHPASVVDTIEVLTPAIAQNRVAVQVQLVFAAGASGAVRQLQGAIEVTGLGILNGSAEGLIARQLQARLQAGAEYAQAWARRNAGAYQAAAAPQAVVGAAPAHAA